MITERISIIIPFYNEEENATTVLEEVLHCQPSAEVIAVDDGSTDTTWQRIKSIEGITGIKLPSNRGQSAAMLVGLNRASCPVCVVMDGDGQNDPEDISKLISHMSSADAVFGYRKIRKDSWSKRVASKVGNGIRRWFTNDGIRDTGCSLKLFRKEMVDCLPAFNGVHRFMGPFFLAYNYKIIEVSVNHRPRTGGESKYNNMGRALRGIYDLFGVCWYLKRRVDIRINQNE